VGAPSSGLLIFNPNLGFESGLAAGFGSTSNAPGLISSPSPLDVSPAGLAAASPPPDPFRRESLIFGFSWEPVAPAEESSGSSEVFGVADSDMVCEYYFVFLNTGDANIQLIVYD
jgi:hypothetical protein